MPDLSRRMFPDEFDVREAHSEDYGTVTVLSFEDADETFEVVLTEEQKNVLVENLTTTTEGT